MRSPDSRLYLYIYDNKVSISNEALLSSYSTRHPYFILGVRSYLGNGSWQEIQEKISAPGKFMPELTIELIKNNGSLYVLGNSTYIDSTFSQVNEIAISNRKEVGLNQLTPDLDEFEGWSLVELSIK
tara:strand:- start:629 stop:1009 length:381 start_codon:yes stop_codon:yes gene_type:complete